MSGRSTRDAIIVMDLETLSFRELSTAEYTGTDGDGLIHMNGFNGIHKKDGSIDLLLTNFRPSVHISTGHVLPDQAATGANATLEIFNISPKENRFKHVSTIVDGAIATPNRVAAVGGSGFYVTNDHGLRKTGLVRSYHALPNYARGLRVGPMICC